MQPEHIHAAGDCRGNRNIKLNGHPISEVIYADTHKGIVVVIRTPYRIKRGSDEFLTRTLKGTVEVFYA